MMVTEDRKKLGLVLDQSIAFNMSLAHLESFVSNGFVDSHQEMKANKHFAQRLQIKTPDLSNPVSGLSGGNQQKVVLAKAMMTQVEVIFLDEPTRGIDIGAKVEVYDLVNQLTDEGKAVVMVSSDMPELIGMSDRILMLSGGRVAGQFDPGDVTQETLLQAAMKYS
jgi:D-xylose transport system ATP-binding protein